MFSSLIDQKQDEINTLKAQNKKLREALQVLTFVVDGLVPDKGQTVKDAIALARTALQETK